MSTASLPAAKGLLTAEEYRSMSPADSWRFQLIEGEIYEMASAPNRFHQKISGNLFLSIGLFLRANPIGELYAAPFDVELDRSNIFQPDLTFISTKRGEHVLVPEGVRGAPDLIVEILSPLTAALDKRKKRDVYAAREWRNSGSSILKSGKLRSTI